jgi:hypothetical protein
LITVWDDSNVPVLVWGDGDIGIGVRYKVDRTGSIVTFSLLKEPKEIGADLTYEELDEKVLLHFLFNDERSIDVLITCLESARQGFYREGANENSQEKSHYQG